MLYSNLRNRARQRIDFKNLGLYRNSCLSYIAQEPIHFLPTHSMHPCRIAGELETQIGHKIDMSGNHRNGTPVYKKIQNSIRKRIEAADLRPGDAVASERELAK